MGKIHNKDRAIDAIGFIQCLDVRYWLYSEVTEPPPEVCFQGLQPASVWQDTL